MQYSDTIGHIVSYAWILFMVVWLVSALSAKRNRVGTNKALLLYRVFAGIVIVVILEYLGVRKSFFLDYIHNPSVRIIGAVLVFLGIALAFWARYHLGRNWGMPLSEKEGAQLVTTGPYAYIRNPIYAAVLLALIGSALVFGMLWLLVIVLYGGYFIYSVFGEEKIMARLFPDQYPAYKARTKRLIPFVW